MENQPNADGSKKPMFGFMAGLQGLGSGLGGGLGGGLPPLGGAKEPFGSLPPLGGGGEVAGLGQPPQASAPEIKAKLSLADTLIKKDADKPQSTPIDPVTYERKESSSEFPPQSSLFSASFPALGEKVQKKEGEETKISEPYQTFTLNKSGFMLNSLEQNAASYLKELSKETPAGSASLEASELESVGATGAMGLSTQDTFVEPKPTPAQVFSFAFKPIILSNTQGKMINSETFGFGGPKPGIDVSALKAQSYQGEIIPAPYHTYNSLENLAPFVAQDENLSLQLNSTNLKIFENTNPHAVAKNLMCFLESSTVTQPALKEDVDQTPKTVIIRNNITLLVNQNDQIQNILSTHHSKGKFQGNILDFTVRKFRYLYLLYAKSIAILDFQDLLDAKTGSDVKILQSIQLNQLSASPNQNEYNWMEVTKTPDQSLLLFSDIASKRQTSDPSGGERSPLEAGILHIDCSKFNGQVQQAQSVHQQTLLQFTQVEALAGKAKGKQETILDVEIWDNHLAVLVEKNKVYVFDVRTSSVEAVNGGNTKKKEEKQKEVSPALLPIFKAVFYDSTEQISRLFYVQEFAKGGNDFSAASDGEASEQSVEEKSKKLKGNFIFLETKDYSKVDSASKRSSKKNFRKLHIVQISDKVGHLNQLNPKTKKFVQSFEQIDMLSCTDQNTKHVEYDPKRGIVFMINNEKSDRLIKMYAVMLKKEINDESESDKKSDDDASQNFQQKLRFYYATEYRLQIGNNSFSAIQKVSQGSKTLVRTEPQFLKVLNVVDPDSLESFFLYVNMLDQVLVFKRQIDDVTPSSEKMVERLSSPSTKSKPNQLAQVKSFIENEDGDIINQLQEMALPEEYKQKIFQQSKELEGKVIDDESEEEDFKGSQMVSNLLQGDSEGDKPVDSEGEKQGDSEGDKPDAMKKIEEECEVEAKRDQDLLQQRINEEIRNTIGEDLKSENESSSKPGTRKDSLVDEKLQVPKSNPMYQRKEKANEKLSGAEDSDDSSKPVLSKKQKKKEKKIQEKKNAQVAQVAQTAVDKAGTLKKQVENLIEESQQVMSKDMKKKANKQQDNIIENFQELTKKYQELAQKINQLYQQVNRQDQQRQEFENSVQRSIRESLTLGNTDSMLSQQVKEIVVPILMQKMRSLDTQVNQQILPHIETTIENLFKSMIESDQMIKQNNKSEVLNEEAIKKLVVKEFREAMSVSIVPQIEQSIKALIGNLQKPLQEINMALCEKLSVEEDRNENMINYYQNSLERLLWIHQRMGMMSQQQLKTNMQQQVGLQQEMAMQMMEGPMMQQINEVVQAQVQQQVQMQVQAQVNQQMQQNVQSMVQQQIQQYLPQMQLQKQPSFVNQTPMTPITPTLNSSLSINSQAIFGQQATVFPQPSAFQNQPMTPIRSSLQQQKVPAPHDEILDAQEMMNQMRVQRQRKRMQEETAKQMISKRSPAQMKGADRIDRMDAWEPTKQSPQQIPAQSRNVQHKVGKFTTQVSHGSQKERVQNYYVELGARRNENEGHESCDDDDAYEKEVGNSYAEDRRLQRDDDQDMDRDTYERPSRRGGPSALYSQPGSRPYEGERQAPQQHDSHMPSMKKETKRHLDALIDEKFEKGRERQNQGRSFQGFEGYESNQSQIRERQLQKHPFVYQNEPQAPSQADPNSNPVQFMMQPGGGRQPGQPRELTSWKGESMDTFEPNGMSGLDYNNPKRRNNF